jgi:hypothetical protein
VCYWNAAASLRRLRPQAGEARLFYVEGWAVRRKAGTLVPFEHGWVELDGAPQDDTPHHHVEPGAYFAAIRRHDLAGDDPPLYRRLTTPVRDDGRRNPSYDPEAALAYTAAKTRAVEFCARPSAEGSGC